MSLGTQVPKYRPGCGGHTVISLQPPSAISHHSRPQLSSSLARLPDKPATGLLPRITYTCDCVQFTRIFSKLGFSTTHSDFTAGENNQPQILRVVHQLRTSSRELSPRSSATPASSPPASTCVVVNHDNDHDPAWTAHPTRHTVTIVFSHRSWHQTRAPSLPKPRHRRLLTPLPRPLPPSSRLRKRATSGF